MRPWTFALFGAAMIILGWSVIDTGTAGRVDQFPVPPIAGWLVVAWGGVIIAYGLLRWVRRKEDKDEPEE